jgi:hypothetical protein
VKEEIFLEAEEQKLYQNFSELKSVPDILLGQKKRKQAQK